MSQTESTIVAGSIMSTPVITTTEQSSIRDAASTMAQNKVSGLPVIDDKDAVVGVITEYDIIWLLRRGGMDATQVCDLMTQDVETVEYDAPLDLVADKILRREIRRLPVTQDERLVGIISRRDLIREVWRLYEDDTQRYESLLQEIFKRGWPERTGQQLSDCITQLETLIA